MSTFLNYVLPVEFATGGRISYKHLSGTIESNSADLTIILSVENGVNAFVNERFQFFTLENQRPTPFLLGRFHKNC